MGRLDNKVAIITGGARGLGFAMAKRFAEEGAQVIVGDMLPVLEEELPNIELQHLNVTSVEDCKAITKYAVDKYGHIDILVNNAGITRDHTLAKMTDQEWDAVIAINLKGVFNLTREVAPVMYENNYGSIISIASIVALYGNIGQTNYAAAKAGIIGMTRTWAKEFGRKQHNVRANAIAPGFCKTQMIATVPDELLKQFEGQTMLGRLGEPKEIANAALFLASDESSYITGQVLSVNGGMRL